MEIRPFKMVSFSVYTHIIWYKCVKEKKYVEIRQDFVENPQNMNFNSLHSMKSTHPSTIWQKLFRLLAQNSMSVCTPWADYLLNNIFIKNTNPHLILQHYSSVYKKVWVISNFRLSWTERLIKKNWLMGGILSTENSSFLQLSNTSLCLRGVRLPLDCTKASDTEQHSLLFQKLLG